MVNASGFADTPLAFRGGQTTAIPRLSAPVHEEKNPVKANLVTPKVLGFRQSLDRGRELLFRAAARFESPGVAYLLIAALQLKVFWGWWSVTDMTAGDTAYYYANAWSWYTAGEANFVWSPLYTLFYSLFLFINPDPIWATVAHRIVIVLSVALLTLAVLRQLLPSAIAWLCAAWWVTNPIVHDAMYESHPFALIPTLAALWLLASAVGPWRRATGLVALGIAALLGRSELSVAVLILGTGLAVLEYWRLRKGHGLPAGGTLLAYTVTLAIAGIVCQVVYSRSSLQGDELTAEMNFKHTLGMRQMFALSYSQRHPEWKLRPMTQGDGLMSETFGKRDPTMREMLSANPKAYLDHATWNLGLMPSGVQLLLFNRASGSVHPDFLGPSDPRLNQTWAAFALGGLVLMWGAGIVVLLRSRSWHEREWLASRSAAWIALFGLACVAFPVTVAYRPRPCFMLGFGVALVALTGLCVWVLATQLRAITLLRLCAPIAAVVLITIHPTFAEEHKGGVRLTRDAITRLQPHHSEIVAAGTTLVGSSNAISLYVLPEANIRRSLNDAISERQPNIIQFASLELEWQSGEQLHALLTRIQADYFYADERLVSWLKQHRLSEARLFLDGQHAPGWQRIEGDDTAGRRWRFYRSTAGNPSE